MSRLGQWLADRGWDVDDNPVLGRPESVPWRGVEWVMLHHYAGSEDPADAPRQAQYAKTAAGRYPPLCHLYQDVTGKVWVISQERPGQPVPGRASHAGAGSYPGIPTNRANEVSLGIEVQESGDTPVSAHPDRYERMIRLSKDCLDFFDLPTSRLIDHDEYAGAAQGKIDLLDDLQDLRRDVAAIRVPVDPDLIVATANFPRRLGVARQQPHVQALADKFGASVIALQELGDNDVQHIRPNGWDWWRPKRAQSAALTWNLDVWEPVLRNGKRVQGSYRLHTPGVKTPPRFVVWAALRHRGTGQVLRFGSFHLAAFKTRNARNAKEFLRQQGRLARWLRNGPRRVAMGDLNADRSLFWTPALVKDAVWETPRMATHGRKKIDHVLRPKGNPRPTALATYEGLPGDHRALIVRL